MTDVVLIKQNTKGFIYFDNTLPADNTIFYRALVPIAYYNHRNFYGTVNPDTKTNYLIVDDVKNSMLGFQITG